LHDLPQNFKLYNPPSLKTSVGWVEARNPTNVLLSNNYQ